MPKRKPRPKSVKLPLILIAVGITLIGYWVIHNAIYWHTLQLSASQVRTESPKLLPAPTHIKIQWFVDAPIETMALVGSTWSVSSTQASFLSQSARPGESGNIIIYGHNTRAILGNIRALKGNETITITTSDGTNHLYKVSQMKETNPDDVSWLEPTPTEVLTMYTCSGLFDSKRFLVRALPITAP